MRKWFAVGLAVLLALSACSSNGGDEDLEQRVEELEQQLAEAPSTTAATETTTTTTTAMTTTTTATTTTAPTDVAQEWLNAMAADEFEAAEHLATSSAGRYTHFFNVANRLDSAYFKYFDQDVLVSEGRVEWIYTDGTSMVFDKVVVADKLVTDFDANGAPISTMVPDEDGEAAEVGGVTVQVVVTLHRLHPAFGSVSDLTVEVDNESGSEIYGWDAQLVGSDRRAVEAEHSYNGSYPTDAISDDVLQFFGADLTEGGELRIRVDYDTFVTAPVPAVPDV